MSLDSKHPTDLPYRAKNTVALVAAWSDMGQILPTPDRRFVPCMGRLRLLVEANSSLRRSLASKV